MDEFAVQFTEVHWDKQDVPKSDGGTRIEYVVDELEAAKEKGQPVILVIYGREADGTQNAVDWRLLAMFFAGPSAVSANAGGFGLYGMNRLCPCWAEAPWKVNGPMILLINHKGKVVRRITSAHYKIDRLAKELQVLKELAARDQEKDSRSGGSEQGTGG